MSSTKSAKIAISLPRPLLDRMERMRRETGESRSALVQRLVRERLAEEERRERVATYVEGYRAHPEGEDDAAAGEASATALLTEEPWE